MGVTLSEIWGGGVPVDTPLQGSVVDIMYLCSLFLIVLF
jgi:hypothetical protein